jgi:methionyl aminopeptidase
MLTLGLPEVVLWDDGWTIATLDGLPSAQFEHTVLVTHDGVEVLTVAADGDPRYPLS